MNTLHLFSSLLPSSETASESSGTRGNHKWACQRLCGRAVGGGEGFSLTYLAKVGGQGSQDTLYSGLDSSLPHLTACWLAGVRVLAAQPHRDPQGPGAKLESLWAFPLGHFAATTAVPHRGLLNSGNRVGARAKQGPARQLYAACDLGLCARCFSTLAVLLHPWDAGISIPTLQVRKLRLGNGFLKVSEIAGFLEWTPLWDLSPRGPTCCFLVHSSVTTQSSGPSDGWLSSHESASGDSRAALETGVGRGGAGLATRTLAPAQLTHRCPVPTLHG